MKKFIEEYKWRILSIILFIILIIYILVVVNITNVEEHQYFEDNCIVERVKFKEGGVVTIPDEYTTYISYDNIIYELKDKESYEYCKDKIDEEIKCEIRKTIYTDKKCKNTIISIIGAE